MKSSKLTEFLLSNSTEKLKEAQLTSTVEYSKWYELDGFKFNNGSEEETREAVAKSLKEHFKGGHSLNAAFDDSGKEELKKMMSGSGNTVHDYGDLMVLVSKIQSRGVTVYVRGTTTFSV